MAPGDFLNFLLTLDTSSPAERLARQSRRDEGVATGGISAREWADRILEGPSGTVHGQEALSTAAREVHSLGILHGQQNRIRRSNEEQERSRNDRVSQRESAREDRREPIRESREAARNSRGHERPSEESSPSTQEQAQEQSTASIRPPRSILRQPSRTTGHPRPREEQPPKRVTFRFQREAVRSTLREDSGL